MRLKRIVYISMLLAIAIVLNILESFIPMWIPGVKLGLANIIVLFMIYKFKAWESFLVMILRIIIVGLLRGNLFQVQWFMSLSGGILSYFLMFIFSRFKFFSPIGISVIGALAHSTGQVIMAIIFIGTALVVYYLPFIAILSTITGIFTGFIVDTLVKRFSILEI